eukprot:1714714-Pyramimonas_sp.AAC.1
MVWAASLVIALMPCLPVPRLSTHRGCPGSARSATLSAARPLIHSRDHSNTAGALIAGLVM